MVNIRWCAGKLPQKVELCEGNCELKHSDVQIIKSDILWHTGVCCYKEIHGVECPECADGKCPCARDRSTADLQAIMVGICPDGESNYDKTKNAREAYIAKEKAKLEKAKEKAAEEAAEEQRLKALAVWEELCAYRNSLLTENAKLEQQIRDEEQRLREVVARNEAAKEAAEAARRVAVKKTYAAALKSGGADSASVNEGAKEAPVAPAVESVDAKKGPVISGQVEHPLLREVSDYVEEKGWAVIVDEGDK
jgi:hypothetical protein